jgi:3-keto-L-gulonate-6-phosphate decarboxylase
MAESVEIVGTRNESEDVPGIETTRIFVSDDGTTGIPVLQELFPDETLITDLKVREIQTDKDTEMPGLYIVQVVYRSIRAAA